jgi:hypothetical protein
MTELYADTMCSVEDGSMHLKDCIERNCSNCGVSSIKFSNPELSKAAEGGAKNFGVFRVKNHDFTPKKIRFIPNAEGSAKIFGVFRVKNHDFTPKKSDFFQMQREARKFLGYFV